MPSICLVYGFEMALGGLAASAAVRCWRLGLWKHSYFTVLQPPLPSDVLLPRRSTIKSHDDQRSMGLPCLSAFCPPRSICHFPSAIPSEPGLHCPSAFCPPGFCHLRSAIGYGRPVSLAFRRSARPASAICDRLLAMAAPSPLPFGVLPSRLRTNTRAGPSRQRDVSIAFRRSALPAPSDDDATARADKLSPLPFGVLPSRLLPFAIGYCLWRPRLPCLSAFCPPGFCHLRSAIVYGGPVSLAFRHSALPASAICDRLLSMAAPSPLPFGVLPSRLPTRATGPQLKRKPVAPPASV
jgi:hypothetical protein